MSEEIPSWVSGIHTDPKLHRYERRERRYNAARYNLVQEMGARCAVDECPNQDLEFDHPEGRDWDPGKISKYQRLKKYREDWLAGKLRLLCQSHNGRDGGGRRYRGQR